MKTIIAIVALLAFAGAAIAADSSVTTTDGKTYDHITALRADPDGLYIEYATPRGGFGCAKVKFSRLSPDLQKEYSYNADAAKKYEDDNLKGEQAFVTWANQQDEVRQKAQADRDARDLQEEMLATRRMVAAAQAGQDLQSAQPYYSPGWDYGYGGYALGPIVPANIRTGSTFKGAVPEGMLFTPLGFSPTKTQFIPATPQSRPSGAARQRPASGSGL